MQEKSKLYNQYSAIIDNYLHARILIALPVVIVYQISNYSSHSCSRCETISTIHVMDMNLFRPLIAKNQTILTIHVPDIKLFELFMFQVKNYFDDLCSLYETIVTIHVPEIKLF